MKEPSLYERIHWFIFNAGAKTIGTGMVIMGALSSLRIIAELFGLAERSDLSVGYLLLFAPISVLGVLMLKAKPYYPEKYKEWYASKKHAHQRQL